MTELDRMLDQCTGKPMDVLDRLAIGLSADVSLLSQLISVAASSDPPRQAAAIGLLKRLQAAEVSFPPDLAARVIELLFATVDWEAKLQLLQMLPRLPLPSRLADPLFDHLQHLLSDGNKFIRAWAYTGLHRLASLDADFRPAVAVLLARAAKEESAAVRARLRQLPALEHSGPRSRAKDRQREPA